MVGERVGRGQVGHWRLQSVQLFGAGSRGARQQQVTVIYADYCRSTVAEKNLVLPDAVL